MNKQFIPGVEIPRHGTLAGLLVLTFLLSAVWAFAIPVPANTATVAWRNFQPDEYSHLSVIRYLATHHVLPPYQEPFDTTVHPPLFHFLSALVYAALTPLWGETAAFRAIRLLCALCGVGVVYFTDAASRRVLGSRVSGLYAAALVALIPQRVSLAGGISNENLAALGAAGALAALTAGIYRGFSRRDIGITAFWIAVGVGSKMTCLGLLPAAAFVLIWDARRRKQNWRVPVERLCVLLGAVALTTGWWWVYNTRYYGDPLRKAAADRLWDAVQPGYERALQERGFSPLRYVGSLLHTAWTSFWGLFDGMRVPLPASVFAILLAVQLVAVLGTIAVLFRRNGPFHRAHRRVCAAMLLLFALYVLGVYLAYNWAHYSPQGRYFFVLLLPFGLVTMGGWQAALPRSLRRGATLLLLLFLLGVNVYALRVIPRRDTITMAGNSPHPAR